MWASKVSLFALVSVLIAATPALASSSGPDDFEVAAFYNSFAPNVGGLSDLGGRVRILRVELEAMYLNSAPAAALSYAYRFDLSRFFVPRFKLGGAYAFSGGNIVSGIGISVPFIPLFGLRLGIGFDMDVFWTYLGSGTKFGVNPVYPLSVIVTF